MAYPKEQCTAQEALASEYRTKPSDIGAIKDPSKAGGSQSSKGTIAPLPKVGRGK